MTMTDIERADYTASTVTLALGAMRGGDPAEVNQLFVHAVHHGCQPHELVAEIIAQTCGQL